MPRSGDSTTAYPKTYLSNLTRRELEDEMEQGAVDARWCALTRFYVLPEGKDKGELAGRCAAYAAHCAFLLYPELRVAEKTASWSDSLPRWALWLPMAIGIGMVIGIALEMAAER